MIGWLRRLLGLAGMLARIAGLEQELANERLRERVPEGHFNPLRQREKRRRWRYRHGRLRRGYGRCA